MNTTKIPATELKVGMQVMTSGGLRTIHTVRNYTSYGHEMLGWCWKPQPRADGLVDCGYSGTAVEQADKCMVEVAA